MDSQNLTVGIRIPYELKEKVDQVSKERGISSSELYRTAINLFFDSMETLKDEVGKEDLSAIQAEVKASLEFRATLLEALTVLKDIIPKTSGRTATDIFTSALVDHVCNRRALRVFEKITGKRFMKTPLVATLPPPDSPDAWLMSYYVFLITHLEILTDLVTPSEQNQVSEDALEILRRTAGRWLEDLESRTSKIDFGTKKKPVESLFPMEEEIAYSSGPQTPWRDPLD